MCPEKRGDSGPRIASRTVEWMPSAPTTMWREPLRRYRIALPHDLPAESIRRIDGQEEAPRPAPPRKAPRAGRDDGSDSRGSEVTLASVTYLFSKQDHHWACQTRIYSVSNPS